MSLFRCNVARAFSRACIPTTIVNCSLSQGVFPKARMDALVKPLLKKPGLDTGYKNLRAVSNLQFLSIVTEKAVFDQ